MPKLTERVVKAAVLAEGREEAFKWDTEVRGFGLRLRGDTKAYVVKYRVGSRQRRRNLGAASVLGVEEARKRARAILADVAAGKDPAEERDAERKAPDVRTLGKDYLEHHAKQHKSEATVKDDDLMLNRYVLPRIGSRRVAEVTRRDVEAIHRWVTDTAGPIRANRVRSLLSKMFALAVAWELRGDNPVLGVKRNEEHKRTRWLNEEELQRLSKALDAHPNQTSANAVRLLLLTGARRNEVLRLRWEHLDLDRGVWTKPHTTTKQGKEHRIPLSAPAVNLLRAMRDTAGSSPWVFPGSPDKRKRTTNGTRPADPPLTTIKTFWASITDKAKLPGVRLHDLRHSFASHLVSRGLSLYVVGQLLGHSNPATTQRYAHLADGALRDAADAFGAVMTNLPKLPEGSKGD